MKKIILGSIILSSLALASEMSIDGKVGYDFAVRNNGSNKMVFAPTLPVTLNLNFNPSDIDLKGSVKLSNNRIDGLFKNNENSLDGFSILGNINFLSDKIAESNFKIGVNADLLANPGSEYEGEAGDLTLEIGPFYNFSKLNFGFLPYYKSNQVMIPKKAGASFEINGYDSKVKATVAYNLEELNKYNTVLNINDLNLKETKENDVLYILAKDSKIESLIPIYFNLKAENEVSPVENLTLNTEANLDLEYTSFSGDLKAVKLTSEQASTVNTTFKSTQYNESEKRKKTNYNLNAEVAKTSAESSSGSDSTSSNDGTNPSPTTAPSNLKSTKLVNLNTNIKLNANYKILDNLSLDITNNFKVNHLVKNFNNGNENNKNNTILTNNLELQAKYDMDIVQVDNLSLEFIGKLDWTIAGTTVKDNMLEKNYELDKLTITTNDNSMIAKSTTYGNYNSKDYKLVNRLGGEFTAAVKYKIFESLAVQGGLGIGVSGDFNKKTDGTGEAIFNNVVPKVFVGATYAW